jgi:hypothetical protein
MRFRRLSASMTSRVLGFFMAHYFQRRRIAGQYQHESRAAIKATRLP